MRVCGWLAVVCLSSPFFFACTTGGATCDADADCESGFTCDEGRKVCVSAAGGGSSGVAGSSSVATATSSATSTTAATSAAPGSSGVVVTSSSRAPSSSGVSTTSSGVSTTSSGVSTTSSGVSTTSSGISPSSSTMATACPSQCAAGFPGSHVTTWSCVGGTDLASCRPTTCDMGFAHCAATGQTCETDTTTSDLHCGACNQPIGTTASACVGGMPTCHGGAACGAGLLCTQGAGGAGACVECLSDGDCGGSEPVCCGGTCTAVSDACGCGIAPGSAPATVCSATGNGGACIASGAIVASAGTITTGHTAGEMHSGQCGCLPGSGMQPVPDIVDDTAVCAKQGNFFDLCRPTDATGMLGICEPQNTPASNGTTPAGNCGALDNTCSIPKGGLECQQLGGYGFCGCDANGDCTMPTMLGGGNHVVADFCDSLTCECRGEANVQCTDPTQPDCCGGSGCVNLQTDPRNCGVCGFDLTTRFDSNTCVNGQARCGPNLPPCFGATPYCRATSGGNSACFACRSDSDCTNSASPVCCAGACVPLNSACGCSTTPGGTAGATCDAMGTGGECVGTSGQPVTRGGVLQSGQTVASIHAGACGCAPAAGMPVSDAVECYRPDGGLADLCRAPGDGGVAGVCIPQDSANCGGTGLACTPARGGKLCASSGTAGTGRCMCTQTGGTPFDPDNCNGNEQDRDGGYHQTTRDCFGDQCACYQSGSIYFRCDPNGTTRPPDCCPGSPNSCVNLRTDPNNCGRCGTVCPSGMCVDGVCSCTSAGQCNGSTAGGSLCLTGGNQNRCVCPTNGNQSCAPGVACTANCGCCAGSCQFFAGQWSCLLTPN